MKLELLFLQRIDLSILDKKLRVTYNFAPDELLLILRLVDDASDCNIHTGHAALHSTEPLRLRAVQAPRPIAQHQHIAMDWRHV